MFTKPKRSMVLLIMVLAFLVVAGCGQKDTDKDQSQGTDISGEPKYGGEIQVIVPQDPDYLDPHLAAASGTQEMMLNVFEGLLKADSNGELFPAVASDYQISEDGLTYTFTLREGIKFHNGEEVTVGDVQYSLERLMGKNTEKALAASFASIEKVETPDDQTVVVILKEVNAAFLANLTAPILPANNPDHNQNPIGTGPFKFVEYLPEQRVVIEKFDEYWQDGVPYLDRVEFRILPDNETAFVTFISGDADIYPRMGIEKLDQLRSEQYYVQGMENMVQLLAFNHKRAPFDDLRVRKAINYAVNVDEIIEAVAYGLGTKLGSNMSPVMAHYHKDGLENLYNQNQEKARELLKEAGYENGFEMTISVPSNYQFHVDTAQVIVNQLEQVGIDAEIELVEWGVWLDRIYTGRDYETTVIALTGKLDPHRILVRYQTDFNGNFLNYSNPDYDQIIDEAVTTTDAEQRVELYKQAQEILAEDAAAVYIMDPTFAIGLQKGIAGYTIYPISFYDLSKVYFTK